MDTRWARRYLGMQGLEGVLEHLGVYTMLVVLENLIVRHGVTFKTQALPAAHKKD